MGVASCGIHQVSWVGQAIRVGGILWSDRRDRYVLHRIGCSRNALYDDILSYLSLIAHHAHRQTDARRA